MAVQRMSRPPLGANVRGSSAWIVWQLVREPLWTRIRQLEIDPNVDAAVVRQLKGTAADMESAAQQYREWQQACSATGVTDSVEVPFASNVAALDCSSRGRGTASMVAASLGCSTRWVTTLISQGKLAAVKRGRSWSVDLSSVEDFKMRGVNAA
jgi:hypothetical protein